MREMLAAFEHLEHEVHFLIAGKNTGRHQSSPETHGQQSILKRILRACLPTLIWETAKDVKLIRLDRRNELRLSSLASKIKPDVIYERSHYGMVAGVRVAQKNGIHHVLEVNSPNVDERIKLSGNSLLARRAQSKDDWIFKHSSHVLVVSTALAKSLNIPQLSKHWSVTPNAIRIGQNKEFTVNLTRKALGIEESAVLLGFVGSIFHWHGLDMMIRAIHQLQKARKNVQAMIVGDGETRSNLHALAQMLGIEDKVHFMGSVKQKDTFAYTQLCDILVMPKSNSYGSPVKIFEYALSEKPCIVPSTAPVREVFKAGLHGWEVEPHEELLVEAINSITSNPSRAVELAQNWRKKVESNHTWRANASIALQKIHHP
tara:strand:- start:6783 stop:7901 length:1119 start_codon:yes stop_codon:yes gene_type:complete